MALHVTTKGDGPDLVLLHGWGMSSVVWEPLVKSLEASFRVTCVDLPGHGQSSCEGMWTLSEVVTQLLEIVPQRFYLLGWSLGGMIALKLAAEHPERVEKLMMLASSAKFVQSDGWPAAQTHAALQDFTEQLTKNSKSMLKRFISLQTQGVEQSEKTTKQLRKWVLGNAPSEAGLKSGLDILRKADLRDDLGVLKVPVCMVLGAEDRLIPKEVGVLSQKINNSLRLHVIKGAAHVPFLSHIKQVQDALA